VDIVWDAYKANSIKNSTREKRGKGKIRKVTGDTKIPANWKAFIQDNTNKKELFAREQGSKQHLRRICSLKQRFYRCTEM